MGCPASARVALADAVMGSITEWQREFIAQPRIWFTEDGDGQVLHFYESKEAAQLEVDFAERHYSKQKLYISSTGIHSLKLSKERWDG